MAEHAEFAIATDEDARRALAKLIGPTSKIGDRHPQIIRWAQQMVGETGFDERWERPKTSTLNGRRNQQYAARRIAKTLAVNIAGTLSGMDGTDSKEYTKERKARENESTCMCFGGCTVLTETNNETNNNSNDNGSETPATEATNIPFCLDCNSLLANDTIDATEACQCCGSRRAAWDYKIGPCGSCRLLWLAEHGNTGERVQTIADTIQPVEDSPSNYGWIETQQPETNEADNDEANAPTPPLRAIANAEHRLVINTPEALEARRLEIAQRNVEQATETSTMQQQLATVTRTLAFDNNTTANDENNNNVARLNNSTDTAEDTHNNNVDDNDNATKKKHKRNSGGGGGNKRRMNKNKNNKKKKKKK